MLKFERMEDGGEARWGVLLLPVFVNGSLCHKLISKKAFLFFIFAGAFVVKRCHLFDEHGWLGFVAHVG